MFSRELTRLGVSPYSYRDVFVLLNDLHRAGVTLPPSAPAIHDDPAAGSRHCASPQAGVNDAQAVFFLAKAMQTPFGSITPATSRHLLSLCVGLSGLSIAR